MGDDSESSMAPPLAQAEADDILILGELVGAYQLSTEELVTSKLKVKHLRPYCIVKFEEKTIHFTSPAAETGRDPIWTISTGSVFLLQVSPSALLHEQLQISVWSKKNVTSLRGAVLLDMDTYFLGKIKIPGTSLLKYCNEERLELPLLDLHGTQEYADSSIALRFRLATESDVRLVELLRARGISPPALSSQTSFSRSDSQLVNPVKELLLVEGSKLPLAETVTETNESQVAGEFIRDALAYAFKASTRSDRESGLRKLRIKPGPDPNRVEETTFMTALQISQETRKPSLQWADAGSGSVGTLHLEILSCHGLPNVDVGEAVGNLTDSFVCAVFEDVMVQTPVIDDELSPHWMPWTQRAFRIGIVHPSSTLYLGVLDYDLGPGGHEPIGRVAVNLTNFQSNTAYTLKYKLHPTSDLSEREPNGIITIRIRIEYNDEKAALLAARQPTPVFHVNTRKHKTFKVLRYTCFGEYDIEEKFTWAVTKSYIGEILEYWRAIKFYTGESFWSLVFWRGQVEICSIRLPVHSAVLFVSGTVLIERPDLIVPFYCLFVAWFMLATMSHRRATPSPWHTCNSFWHYIEVLATGKSTTGVKHYIRPHEYSKQTEEYDAAIHEWLERYQSSLDSRAAMEEKLMSIGDENITTAVSGQMLPVDLLEKLGRYQGIVGRICTRIRRIKSIIIWEDSTKSFWIAATYSGLGLVGLLLPWRFILYLVGRIVVWGCLGPHMKFVDIYLQQSNKDKAARELEDFRQQSRLARIRREEAVKLKDVKCLAFGEFVTLVPSENLPRHYDRPLHESLARHVPNEGADRMPATSRIPGQQLYGAMIPHTKIGFQMVQQESANSQTRVAELEQQLARLQDIEERLSSRAVETSIDQELPDDMGYEVTLFEHKHEESISDTKDDTEVTVSLSPTGLKSQNETFENCSTGSPKTKHQFLKTTARKLVQERLDEEDDEDPEEEDSEHDSKTNSLEELKSLDDTKSYQSSFVSQQGYEVDETASYMTPLQTYPKPGENQHYVMSASFMTPLQDDDGSEPHPPEEEESDSMKSFMTPSHEPDARTQNNDACFMTPEQDFVTPEQDVEEEKKEDDCATAMLDLPDLKTDKDKVEAETVYAESKAVALTKAIAGSLERRLKGPRGKAAEDATEKSNQQQEDLDLEPKTEEAKAEENDQQPEPQDLEPRDKAVTESGTATEEDNSQLEPLDLNLVKSSSRSSQDKAADAEALDLDVGPSPKSCQSQITWSFSTATELASDCGSRDDMSPKAGTVAYARSFVTARGSLMSGSVDASEVTVKMKHNLEQFGDRQGDTTPDLSVRRTWSSSSLQKEKTWIKQSPTDTIFEMHTSKIETRRSSVICEEGMEIVAMGRLRTIGDEDLTSEEGDDSTTEKPKKNESVNYANNAGAHGLSVPYKESNSHVQVAHFRP
ncbi:expressed unknown protein [Seminavis robusta]|uniref:C2 domain-containing protein n=1 Tax=Seminavis robusta TaxID=568900 RepID=A0A9N8HIA0_9STRA|nr:expressed unknown protein [Seminavis robusta]|eukprot:Sro611_g175270.1 n/a (1419) ;mRNA; r:10596-14852